ncbi:MAG: HAD family hydrolase [Dehalococcoidia bacterium]
MKPVAPGPPPRLKAIVFDLDVVLLDRSRAWANTLEQAVLLTTGARIDARALIAEYVNRPWRHALGVVLADLSQRDAAEARCRELFARSAMKHLLVHEGIGMALDRLRGARVEMGAISREPHRLALSQIESTGLDRFLTMLAPTPAGERWHPEQRVRDCLSYFDRPASVAAFVSADVHELAAVSKAGLEGAFAAWAAPGDPRDDVVNLGRPKDLARLAGVASRGDD